MTDECSICTWLTNTREDQIGLGRIAIASDTVGVHRWHLVRHHPEMTIVEGLRILGDDDSASLSKKP